MKWSREGFDLKVSRPIAYPFQAFPARAYFASMAAGLVGCAGPTGSTVHVSAPSITAQPANQTVVAGQTATFTVVATGAAPLSYQWQKNGANITSGTSSSYTTAATVTSDGGSTFDVVVSNSAGTAWRRAILRSPRPHCLSHRCAEQLCPTVQWGISCLRFACVLRKVRVGCERSPAPKTEPGSSLLCLST